MTAPRRTSAVVTAASAAVDPIDVLPITGATRWDFATGDALQRFGLRMK